MCNNFYLNLIYDVVYLYVLIVFLLHEESLKLIQPIILRWFCHNISASPQMRCQVLGFCIKLLVR
jgi:hypothetical protein